MVLGGLPEERMLRVQGLAASKLLDPKQPESPLNRRISIIVMNRDAEDAVLKGASDEEDNDVPSAADMSKMTQSAASGAGR
jgi:chemotaxis protein MotB